MLTICLHLLYSSNNDKTNSKPMQIMEMPKSRKEKLDELHKGDCIEISPAERASYSTEIQRSFHGVNTNKKRFTIRTDKQTGLTGVWRLI